MKKRLIACTVMSLALAGIASNAESSGYCGEGTSFISQNKVAELTWKAANIDALRSLDEAAIAKFQETAADENGSLFFEGESMGGFTWADLAGDGRYELLITEYTRAYSCLVIFWQDAPGRLTLEPYEGASLDPKQMIEDLNGDGKKELILSSKLDTDARTPHQPAPVAEWPQVYRLRNGRYVEASRDFPRFYDTEVLPELEKNIAAVQNTSPSSRESLSRLLIQRILCKNRWTFNGSAPNAAWRR